MRVVSSQFENNYFTEMCSGSEAGSYLRLIDFAYHSTLGLRVIKKIEEEVFGSLQGPTIKSTQIYLQRLSLSLTIKSPAISP